MRKRLMIILLAMTALCFLMAFSCRGKRARLQEKAVLPDKTLFANGLGFLSKHQFIKARLSFQTLINTYEDSEYLEKAKYFIAYSYLKEGGIENLTQAEQGFKDFKLFFPTSEMADLAQAYVVRINMHLMEAPNRDLSHAKKAQTELRTFFKEFPNSPLLEQMKMRVQYVEDVLATSSFLKGEFYQKRKMYRASTSRLKECVQNYPDYGRRDEALFMLAEALDHQKNFDESAGFYAQIAKGYPFSPYFEKAKERLRKLEKTIPEVDEKLAAQNKKNWYQPKPVLLAPIRSAVASVGIGGTEQPWEQIERAREKKEFEQIKAIANQATPEKPNQKKSPPVAAKGSSK